MDGGFQVRFFDSRDQGTIARENLMCPICISAAALATLAGSGSAGGLATLVAVKLHIRRRKDGGSASRSENAKRTTQTNTVGGGQ